MFFYSTDFAGEYDEYGERKMKRPFLAAGISAFAAVAFREWLFRDSALDIPILLISFSVAVIAAIFAFIIKTKRSMFASFSFIMICFAVFSGLWTLKNNERESIVSRYSGTEVDCEISITQTPVLNSNNNYRYIGKIVYPRELASEKVVFYGFDEENIVLGSRVSGVFTLDKTNDDNNSYYRYNNITFFASRDYSSVYEVKEPEGFDFSFFIGKIKNEIEKKVYPLFGDSSGMVLGLLFGDTDGISPEIEESFRLSGLSHLLAVSGLNVGIISIFVFYLFSFSNKRVTPYLVATVFIIIMAALSGFSPSVLRAVVMQLFIFVGKILYKDCDTKNIFGFAVFIFILVNPFIVSSPSFLLSFAATAALIFLYHSAYSFAVTELFRRRSIVLKGVGEKFFQAAIVSLLCSIVTAPITYACFGTVTFLGVISNILIYPFVSVTFISSVVAVLISFIPVFSFFAPAVAYIPRIGIPAMIFVSNAVSSLSGAVIDYSPDMSFISDYRIILSCLLCLIFGGFVWFVFSDKFKIKRKSNKNTIRVCSVIVAFAVCSLGVWFFTDESAKESHSGPEVEAAFINVGQGNGVVISQGDSVYLYDCGGTEEPGDNCAEYILSRGYDVIDVVIISHMHSDHMNGVKKLLEKVDAREVVIPYISPDEDEDMALKEFLDEKGVKLTVLYEDTEIFLDNGARFELLLKHMDEDADENDNSIILSLDYYDTDLILCGDLSSVGEKRLIEEYPFLDTDIFAVGHHGSKYSACEEFLSQITPSVSVISVGARNPYGHPDKDTLSRLEDYGDVYCTKDYGNIIFTLDGTEYTVKTEK